MAAIVFVEMPAGREAGQSDPPGGDAHVLLGAHGLQVNPVTVLRPAQLRLLLWAELRLFAAKLWRSDSAASTTPGSAHSPHAGNSNLRQAFSPQP
jgi:hypothetical protein